MQAKLLFPKKASVDEPLDMAAAPSPKNTIATPKFVKIITNKNFKNGILVIPVASVVSSVKAGTGRDKIRPITSIFFAESSALRKSSAPIIFQANGLAAYLPAK